MRISDWSSDVCSSDLIIVRAAASVAPVKDHLENSRLLLPLRRTHRVRCLELVEQRTDNVREFLLLNLGKMIEACSHRLILKFGLYGWHAPAAGVVHEEHLAALTGPCAVLRRAPVLETECH